MNGTAGKAGRGEVSSGEAGMERIGREWRGEVRISKQLTRKNLWMQNGNY